MIKITAERKWILVVDDEPEIRQSVAEFLRLNCDETVRVVEAADGLEATSKINYQKFHCIVTDMNMPNKEGDAFITSVRNNAFNENTPVIVMSGFVDSSVESRHPFVYFMEKPFNSLKMVELVKKQLDMGGTKTRLSAGVFNDLVEQTSQFLEKIMDKDNVKVGMATLKEKGEPVEADYASNIEVKIGKVSNTFSVLAKEKDVTKIMSKLDEDKDKEEANKAYKLMNTIIIKHVLSKNKLVTVDRFRAEQITHDQAKLINKRGILIPLEVDGINLEIFASVA